MQDIIFVDLTHESGFSEFPIQLTRDAKNMTEVPHKMYFSYIPVWMPYREKAHSGMGAGKPRRDLNRPEAQNKTPHPVRAVLRMYR